MVGIRWWLACGVLGKNKEESSISAFPAGQMLLDRRVSSSQWADFPLILPSVETELDRRHGCFQFSYINFLF